MPHERRGSAFIIHMFSLNLFCNRSLVIVELFHLLFAGERVEISSGTKSEAHWKSISCCRQTASIAQTVYLLFTCCWGISIRVVTWLSGVGASFTTLSLFSVCVIHHTDGCWYHLLSWLLLFGSLGGDRTPLPTHFQEVKSNVTSKVYSGLKSLHSGTLWWLCATPYITTFCGFLSLLLDGVVTGHILILGSLFWWLYEWRVIACVYWFGAMPRMTVKTQHIRTVLKVMGDTFVYVTVDNLDLYSVVFCSDPEDIGERFISCNTATKMYTIFLRWCLVVFSYMNAWTFLSHKNIHGDY